MPEPPLGGGLASMKAINANAINDIINVVGMANYLNVLMTCRSPLCMFVDSKRLVPLVYSTHVDNTPVYEVGIGVQHLNPDKIGSSAIYFTRMLVPAAFVGDGHEMDAAAEAVPFAIG